METIHQTAVFGAGCFWCTEAIYESLHGVIKVRPGYAGGHALNPTYEEVSTGNTGHAEVIKIDFDPSIISFEDLLTVFFASHDPTSVNRQGNDIGTQYRSIILVTSDQQKHLALDFIKKLNEDSNEKKVATEVISLKKFFEAEKYHHHYFKSHPNQAYCQLVINPKLEKIRHRFNELMKSF
ncbi:peptide-methionine (S)-S-oxide reductase MsrA [Candidatus Uhrbacteria bacterium]|nr:peptide-methionine (S)-S-oxide reductase MsrA [Candidatus Uhrbacteria bacterium]